MGTRRNDRLAVFGIGVGAVGVAASVVLIASADDRSTTAANDDPEIAMPAPMRDFEDLSAEPPAVGTVDTMDTSSTSTTPTVRTLRLSGAMTLEVRFSPLDEDRRATYTLTGTFFGDMTGEWVEEGTEQYGDVDAEDHVRSVGSGTATAVMTVPGIGTGTVESTNEWRSDNQGSVLGVSTITSGSGDLEGVTGTMRWNSTDDAGTITYQLDLTLP